MTSAAGIDLETVHNFRALGPYATSTGTLRADRIYRSGALDLVNATDAAFLGNALGIRTILDLRHPDEFGPGGIGHALADRVTHISIFPGTTSQAEIIAELNGIYGVGISPGRYLHYLGPGGPQFAKAFELFADEANYPFLVHCTAGKDRTGVLLALIMDVIGVADEEIAVEYGLSEASIPRLIAFLEASGRVLEGTPEEIRARLATPPEKMAGFLVLLREKYGSAAAYLEGQGVPREKIELVRQLLTA